MVFRTLNATAPNGNKLRSATLSVAEHNTLMAGGSIILRDNAKRLLGWQMPGTGRSEYSLAEFAQYRADGHALGERWLYAITDVWNGNDATVLVYGAGAGLLSNEGIAIVNGAQVSVSDIDTAAATYKLAVNATTLNKYVTLFGPQDINGSKYFITDQYFKNKVGIGNVLATQALDVTGSIKASGFFMGNGMMLTGISTDQITESLNNLFYTDSRVGSYIDRAGITRRLGINYTDVNYMLANQINAISIGSVNVYVGSGSIDVSLPVSYGSSNGGIGGPLEFRNTNLSGASQRINFTNTTVDNLAFYDLYPGDVLVIRGSTIPVGSSRNFNVVELRNTAGFVRNIKGNGPFPAAVPAATAGGGYLVVLNGALMFRGGNGTLTTVAPA